MELQGLSAGGGRGEADVSTSLHHPSLNGDGKEEGAVDGCFGVCSHWEVSLALRLVVVGEAGVSLLAHADYPGNDGPSH